MPVDETKQRKYYGADWIKRVEPKSLRRGEMSDLGVDVANLLGDLFRGIYHIEDSVMKADWTNDYHIDVVIGRRDFSTCDFNTLTNFVILCHDRCIRGSIEGVGHGYLRLRFHRRYNRDGRMMERHPTIEEAVRLARQEWGEPEV